MNKTIPVRQMAIAGLMTAVICVLAPFSLHIAVSPVPISLGTLAIYFVLTVLGMKWGTLCVLLYILLGFVGLPVFADFSSGAVKLLGPTGGYIVGYLFLALIGGFFLDHWKQNIPLSCLGLILGTAVCYFFGTLWLAIQLQLTFPEALMLGVVPYIPGDIVKLLIAMALGWQLRKRLHQAGLL